MALWEVGRVAEFHVMKGCGRLCMNQASITYAVKLFIIIYVNITVFFRITFGAGILYRNS
jgi:hypothetical protein